MENKVRSITFDTADGVLTVTFENDDSISYTDRESYLIDYPDRESDCDAMGWNKY